MTHTVFIDLDSHVATASASGTAAPNVPLKHLTKQTLAFAFHSGGTVQAVTGWVSGRVIVKATPTSDVLLLDTTLAVTGSTTSTRYSAEWASADCDSAAMRTLIGASTEPLDVWAEIQWTDADGTYAVAFPIQIVPTFNLPEDDPPDPVADASWTWLKARLAAGTNVTFSDNDTTKVRTISAALSEVAWSAITGTPTTLSGYGITDAQPLATILTTLAALSNSAGVLTNNGSGTLSYTGTSTGSTGSTGLIATFPDDRIELKSGAQIDLRGPISEYPKQTLGNNIVRYLSSFSEFTTLAFAAPSGTNTVTLPAVTGTVVTTGNLSAITATGTIASGTWQGSVIGPAYLGTGTDITAKFLRGDGTWQAVSSGITINTTAITGGTSGRVLYNNAGTVGELTTTGTGDVVRATTPTLTGPVIVDRLTSANSVNMSVYAGASARLYLGGGNNPFGQVTIGAGEGLTIYDAGGLRWTNGANTYDTADTALHRDAAGIVSVRFSTAAQGFRVCNTYTSGTNYEAAVMDWQTTANTLRIGTDVGSGGGSSRALAIITGGTARINVGASGELGFFGATAIAKPTVTGAHGGNAALQSLITAMANLGLITDSTT